MNSMTQMPAQKLLSEAPNYNFYQLVDLLHRVHGDDQECDQDFKAGEQRVRFSASASVGFPKSDVQGLSHFAAPGADSTQTGYCLETTFLGLHGAQSPLPYHYIDTTSYEYAQHYPGLHNFLDFFNQRLLTLFYRAWRKYRYYVRFQADASDQFSQQMYSLVGLADPSLRGETPINWCKMLSYTGTLAARSRSAQVVSGIVAHYFELEHVSIDQWVHRYVDIPAFQQVAMGEKNCSLGEDFTLGERAHDRSGKFTLVIEQLSQARFKEFLPNGKNYGPLVKLIEFVMREPLAFDLSLSMIPRDLKSLELGDEKSCRLGWTTFIGDQQKLRETSRSVLIQVRS
ncbi:MAG: type VI secretion system baseplate subunit TssG [Pseudomonadales bacterium]